MSARTLRPTALPYPAPKDSDLAGNLEALDSRLQTLEGAPGADGEPLTWVEVDPEDAEVITETPAARVELGYGVRLSERDPDSDVEADALLEVGGDTWPLAGGLELEPDYRKTGLNDVTLIQDATLLPPKTSTDGVYVLLVRQGDGGGCTLTLDPAYLTVGGKPFTLSLAPRSLDVLTILVSDETLLVLHAPGFAPAGSAPPDPEGRMPVYPIFDPATGALSWTTDVPA